MASRAITATTTSFPTARVATSSYRGLICRRSPALVAEMNRLFGYGMWSTGSQRASRQAISIR
jgi:hypothetical protein